MECSRDDSAPADDAVQEPGCSRRRAEDPSKQSDVQQCEGGVVLGIAEAAAELDCGLSQRGAVVEADTHDVNLPRLAALGLLGLVRTVGNPLSRSQLSRSGWAACAIIDVYGWENVQAAAVHAQVASL